MNLYIIPTDISRKLVYEYRMVYAKPDMRTSFCRKNADHAVDPIVVIQAISKYGVHVKDDRLIMPDHNAAYMFAKAVAGKS